MKRKAELPELLSPAGDFRCLLAAVAAGADAVYVGGKRFGARAYAKNFDTEELSRAVRYCRLHGVKLYVTVNTLVLDKELSEVVDYARELYRIGVDALIIADLGAMAAIHRVLPDLELHASTQMSVHNSLGVDEAAELGALRVVLARELSLENIKIATENSAVETEVFLHGALCVCHSGQCLFSSLVGGRSGNRGECAQPCRLPYNGKYPLSLSDLSLSAHIPALIDSGVASLKIEGRMKSAEYVYTVTKIYRRLLDEHRAATKEEDAELRRAFSRGSFTDGYFVGNPDGKMTGVRSEEDKAESRSIAEMTFEPRCVSVTMNAEFKLGEPSMLTVSDGKRSVTVYGAVPRRAENAPLTREALAERLGKLGGTFLTLDGVSISLDEGINLSPAEVNALRRSGVEALLSTERSDTASKKNEAVDTPAKSKAKRAPSSLISAEFLSADAYYSVAKSSPDALGYFDLVFLPIAEKATGNVGVSIPPVVTDTELTKIRELLIEHKENGVKYALCSNLGALRLARERGLTPVGNFRLNVTNGESLSVYSERGAERVILSPELTLPQARDIGGSVIGYGRIPLMLTERCFIKENFGCNNCNTAALTDRLGERFPLMREYGHRNLVLNSRITYIGDKPTELLRYSVRSVHFIFTTESPAEIKAAIAAFKSHSELGTTEVRRIGKNKAAPTRPAPSKGGSKSKKNGNKINKQRRY